MVNLLQTLRRATVSGQSRDGDALRALPDGDRRLGSTIEQLERAGALIEGLGQLKLISTPRETDLRVTPEARVMTLRQAQEPPQPVAATPARAPAPRRGFALGAWVEEQAEKARLRASRSWVQRLERALAPLAYPG